MDAFLPHYLLNQYVVQLFLLNQVAFFVLFVLKYIESKSVAFAKYFIDKEIMFLIGM